MSEPSKQAEEVYADAREAWQELPRNTAGTAVAPDDPPPLFVTAFAFKQEIDSLEREMNRRLLAIDQRLQALERSSE